MLLQGEPTAPTRLTRWARGHDTTANQNTPNVTMIRKKHSLYRFDSVHARCIPEIMMRTSPLHWTFSPWIYYFYHVSSIKRKEKNITKKPKYIETALLWKLPSRFCGCGRCSRSVQSSQTERAAMFYCLTMNANSTRSTLACLAVVFPSTFTCTLNSVVSLDSFAQESIKLLHASSLDLWSLCCKLMSINSM